MVHRLRGNAVARTLIGDRQMSIVTKTPSRKPSAPKAELVSFKLIKNGKEILMSHPAMALTDEVLANADKASNTLDQAITDSLLIGKALPYSDGASYIKGLKANGDKEATSKNRRASYLALQTASKIREVTTEPLMAMWNNFTDKKIAERAVIQKENIALKAKGEPEKALPRIQAPNLKGLLDLVLVKEATPDFDKIVKYITSGANLIGEQKGKDWARADEMASALLAFIEGLK